jgi:BlaI family transcriptional regulator, penicillinase repressor
MQDCPSPNEASGDRISDAEYVVMDVLWNEAPLTANMVADRLRGSQSWSLPTIKTLLSA